jgi:hypothetical protein
MPSLSYKSFLVPRVVDGSKPHSIRAWRKRPFKVGDRIAHFTGSRFNPRRIRPDTFCTSAAGITIDADQGYVILADYSPRYGFGHLSPAKVHELALADGFASVAEFFNFFQEEHAGKLHGQLIEWDPFASTAGATLENGEPAAARSGRADSRPCTPLSPVCSSPRARGKREPRGRGRKAVAATPSSHGAK